MRRQLIAAIADGELRPGDQLPSVRSLASDLGINLHTVNKAYAILREEGYLLMRRRAGAIVSDRSMPTASQRADAQDQRMREELHRIALAYKARGGSRERFAALADEQAATVFDRSSNRSDQSARSDRTD
ncbi:GntR family transcriptional regulator [Bifidobacterium sp.]|uniref:GntR family transcriptional regulator n=1 Tax=Bifidobacterium sp. TaxID=41200 RepID=UPI0025C2FC91|nr:GntR family transcriptional regulator [Bifidobacterium sp.]